jgi:signal transduction histidine kinase
MASRPTTNIPRFRGNRRQLQEVIVNLLRNAIEAMDITTDRNRVLRLKTERRGVDAIVLSVEDSGPGIDPKNLESIFDAFVTTKRHGMGLGLAICRVIVNQHGGQLTASSNGKDGALFRVVLPVGSGAPAAHQE